MSHEIDMSNGRANVAYRGETPWHGLGFAINAGDSPEVIAQKAGLKFNVKKAAMQFVREDGTVGDAAELNRSVLYRDDTGAPLSVMSTKGYHIVQPAEIMDFIATSARAMGWEIETAGSLKGGRKVWALANMGTEAEIGKGDKVIGYLLAATACDGSMASEFKFTTVRVVCKNTLEMAVGRGADDSAGRVKVYHFNTLDVDAVKKQLGIATSSWARFVENAKRLASIKLSEQQAVRVLRTVYEKQPEKVIVGDTIMSDADFLKANTTARKVLELYQGAGIGMDLSSAKGTAWGLVNATTEFYDHASNTRSVDNRLNSAWFGPGADRKADVVDACLEMA